MDLRDQLEAASATEPPHRDIADRLVAGRRALRRRRWVTAAAGVATAAVVATAALLAGPGQSTGGSSGVATQPTSSPTVDRDGDTPERGLPRDEWVDVRADGGLVLADGVEEVRRLENPMGLEPPATSVGLELRRGDQVLWFLYHADSATGPHAMAAFEARVGHESLEAWVGDMTRLHRGQPLEHYVAFADDGTLRPVGAHVDLVRQVADPDLPDNYDGGLETAVAEVVVDGTTYYVLARDPGNPDYIPVPASVGGATLEDFLDYARVQYAGGEGLR